MSLYGSLQIAGNTLQAMQIGLHVVGNNIANANTPGYIRESVIYKPAPVQKIGNLTLGLGVEVAGIVQNLDQFVEDRLRDAGGDRASAEIQEKAYRELEGILGELTDTDLSSTMTNFFNSIDEVLNEPENVSIRGLAIGEGEKLASALRTLDRRVSAVHQDFNEHVEDLSNEINTLTEEISKLNLKIVTTEGGGGSSSKAGALRSQRQVALKRLAEIVDITVNEQQSGATTVLVNGQILVFYSLQNEVELNVTVEGGLQNATIQFVENNSPLEVSGGELHGVYEARDTITGGFLAGIDHFAGTLANEFNRIFSQGQGVTGFDEVTSTARVSDAGADLDNAGLEFTPVNGQFDLLVYNTSTGLTTPTRIDVDLNGLDGDSTLSSIATAIGAVNGVTTEVSFTNELIIRSDSEELQFGFSNDTSGLLAAIGINTFFTGSTASDLAVNGVLLADSSKFAASTEGIGVGTVNAQRLIALHDESLDSLDGNSLTGLYDQLVNDTTQGSTVSQAVAEGLRTFESTLDAEAQSVSGVNLDEEAIRMITLQRTYQATARYISTLSELLDTLVNL
ncbi:MAG: flagellar hook-associated protein FlgK [Pirellulales bacterium]